MRWWPQEVCRLCTQSRCSCCCLFRILLGLMVIDLPGDPHMHRIPSTRLLQSVQQINQKPFILTKKRNKQSSPREIIILPFSARNSILSPKTWDIHSNFLTIKIIREFSSIWKTMIMNLCCWWEINQ